MSQFSQNAVSLEVLLFGITRDIIGGKTLKVELNEEKTVEELRRQIVLQYPQLEDLSSLMVAVNNEYAQPQTLLHTSDEVALIPPVSGG